MRLHHHPFSSNARRAVMTAHHLAAHHAGAPKVELVLVDLGKGQQRSPEYLKLNPMGRVPTLEDGDFVLTESQAIMIHLAQSTPDQTVYPSELRARSRVNQWLFWCAHHFAPAVAVLNWERVVKSLVGAGPEDANEIARGERLVAENLRVLDQHLEGRAFLSGDALTLADLSVSTPLMSIGPARLPIENSKNVLRWFASIQELPAWKATS
ncbi:MAG: glutathione S-transferase family protein [Deltaproteobacteria bacterium]|nr:glutathione S-transferase family protein [Deltaproteobacteria bacterium]